MYTIYHNPRCSKSREALTLLQQRAGDQLHIIEYLKTPPTAAELTSLLAKLNIPARQLLRTKEPEYNEQNLADPALTEADIINIMVKYPKLIERPIVINGERAAIGRPIDNISAIL